MGRDVDPGQRFARRSSTPRPAHRRARKAPNGSPDQEALSDSDRTTVAGSVASTTYVPVFVASAEDTVVAKLEWSKLAGGSERQRRDVGGILAARGAELDRVYIERWVFELDLAEEWAAAQAVVP